jgi:trans-aconitate methyltransferase
MSNQSAGENRRTCIALCESLYAQWDPMFSDTVDPTRRARMDAILEALMTHFHGPIVVLDLGSGPGTLTERVLRRFPRSHVVAVDSDPVLLRVGSNALRKFGNRATWVRADLRRRGWATGLPFSRFDAAVSSLVLHWLEENEVRTLYRNLRSRLRPGGLLVNGDFLSAEPDKTSRSTQGARREAPSALERQRRFKSRWETWWRAVQQEPTMQTALNDRFRRMPGEMPPRRTTGPRTPVSLQAHEEALRDAGFREIETRWKERGFRVLTGVR